VGGGGGGGGGGGVGSETPRYILKLLTGVLPGGGGGQTDGSSTSNSSSATSRLEPAPRLEVSSGELAGIIVAVVLVTLLCVTVAVWLLRRKKNKSQTLSMEARRHAIF